ncbi:MAG: D-glycerate dehydrogenase [Parcubacteria group bacterium]|nr:D-glycerate dehydrogenase [Parcubacteria group bacterium]
MPKIFVTRKIPDSGIIMLQNKGWQVDVNPKDKVLSKNELIKALKGKNYDAVLCLLTDKIDDQIFEATGSQVKIFANYAVGFDNIDLEAAKKRGIMITNTPGVLTDTVAEHTFALMLSIAHRIAESDKFTKTGKYKGWAPMLLLGTDVSRKTLGIIGLGRIGSRVAYHAVKGFEMKVLYTDKERNLEFEKDFSAQSGKEYDAKFVDLATLLQESDFISIHVPLLPATHHLIGEKELKIMKPGAYLINTSRGPIIDEKALVKALKEKWIKGAALDVYEFEPKLSAGLNNLDNIILTPHTASATEETRSKMAELAAINIIEFLEGRTPPNLVK